MEELTVYLPKYQPAAWIDTNQVSAMKMDVMNVCLVRNANIVCGCSCDQVHDDEL